MTKKDFEKLFLECIQSLKQQVFVPYDTGNLKFNAIMWRWHGNTFTIYIDEKVAPYVYYTNGDKALGKRMDAEIKRYNEAQKGKMLEIKRKGNKGLKYGWIDKMVEYIASYIANRLNGEMKR
jgi:hypothetical protein